MRVAAGSLYTLECVERVEQYTSCLIVIEVVTERVASRWRHQVNHVHVSILLRHVYRAAVRHQVLVNQ